MAGRSKDFADRGVVPWARRRCLLLTTYRRDGTPVASPVWFVTSQGEVRLWTATSSGKVKRVRHDSRCTIAPCTVFGRVTGGPLAGHARILPTTEAASIQSLLRAKYSVQKRLLDGYAWFRRRGRPASPEASTHIAISLAP
jgi:PPOX class probable F420-dependent enzyme